MSDRLVQRLINHGADVHLITVLEPKVSRYNATTLSRDFVLVFLDHHHHQSKNITTLAPRVGPPQVSYSL